MPKKVEKSLPSFSLIIPTFNSAKFLPGLFRCINKQDYPKDKIEVLVMEGGSSDDSRAIAEKNGAKVINNPDTLAEPGVNLGMRRAKNDLFVVMAVDNYLEQKNALSTIAKVFSDPSIVAAFPKHDSDKSDTVWSRYANTFTDPFSHFVYGDAANLRTFDRVYKTIEKNPVYDIYDYSSNRDRPLIAFAQAFVIRSSFRRDSADEFDDISPIMKLVDGKKKMAYVHSVSVYHHTITSLNHFIKKQKWATINAVSGKNYGISHRINYLSPKQRLRIKIWPLYALSLVFPLLRSIYGAARDREVLWLLHPFMCLVSAYASISAIIEYKFSKKTVSRQ